MYGWPRFRGEDGARARSTVAIAIAIAPRNAARRIEIGNDRMVFGDVSSSPNFRSLGSGKLAGTCAQCRDLSQIFNSIHLAGGQQVKSWTGGCDCARFFPTSHGA